MRSLFHRHYTTSINTSDPNSLVLEIIDLCKSGFLSQSLKLLRSLNPLKIAKKPIIYASLLQACAKNLSLRQGNALHSHIIKLGIDSDRYISNSLLALHFKCSEISETRRVFDFLALKDVVTWTSMISSYVRANEPKRAFELYSEMEEQGVEPNEYTLSSLIKACGEMGNLERGKLFHEMVSEKGFESNCVITSALIDMYGKCSSFEEARKVFDEREQRDTICWTSLMASYTQNNQFKEALELFMLMQRSPNVKPDGFTFGTAIAACGNLGLIKQGKQIHRFKQFLDCFDENMDLTIEQRRNRAPTIANFAFYATRMRKPMTSFYPAHSRGYSGFRFFQILKCCGFGKACYCPS